MFEFVLNPVTVYEMKMKEFLQSYQINITKKRKLQYLWLTTLHVSATNYGWHFLNNFSVYCFLSLHLLLLTVVEAAKGAIDLVLNCLSCFLYHQELVKTTLKVENPAPSV